MKGARGWTHTPLISHQPNRPRWLLPSGSDQQGHEHAPAGSPRPQKRAESPLPRTTTVLRFPIRMTSFPFNNKNKNMRIHKEQSSGGMGNLYGASDANDLWAVFALSVSSWLRNPPQHSIFLPRLSPFFLQKIHVKNSICDQLHNQATREGNFSERKSVQVLSMGSILKYR